MKPETIIIPWQEAMAGNNNGEGKMVIHGHTTMETAQGLIHAAVVTRTNGEDGHQEAFINKEGQRNQRVGF